MHQKENTGEGKENNIVWSHLTGCLTRVCVCYVTGWGMPISLGGGTQREYWKIRLDWSVFVGGGGELPLSLVTSPFDHDPGNCIPWGPNVCSLGMARHVDQTKTVVSAQHTIDHPENTQ